MIYSIKKKNLIARYQKTNRYLVDTKGLETNLGHLCTKINKLSCLANLGRVDHLAVYDLQKGWVIISVEI